MKKEKEKGSELQCLLLKVTNDEWCDDHDENHVIIHNDGRSMVLVIVEDDDDKR